MSKNILFEFYRDESGATAIEYAMLTVFIAIGLIVSMSSLGDSLSNSYTSTGNAFPK